MDAIQGIARMLQLPLVAPTGAPIFTGHAMRVSGAVHLARAGIDSWRIQLHGRWGSAAVLRYVRLSPLAASLALEASLGRDLRQVQTSILAAKARLASLTSVSQGGMPHADTAQVTVDDVLGVSLTTSTGPLGKPKAEDILAQKVKGWSRKPFDKELVVINDKSATIHSLRPPRFQSDGACLVQLWCDIVQETDRPTWCGCTLSERAVASLAVISEELLQQSMLCKRCFGKQTEASDSTSSNSSE